MEFIQTLLENSNLKEAKLYGAAQKAATNPEIGITIQNKAAYFVIKDCAAIAMTYLPHLVFSSYMNPFDSLKGKFKKEAIVEFVKLSETNTSLNQLLDIILAKAEKMKLMPNATPTSVVNRNFENSDNSANPYGSYGFDSEPNVQQETSLNAAPAETLCKLFSVF